MLQQLHGIPKELSQYADEISQLCVSNQQFAGLYTQFDKVNDEVHRIASASDDTSVYLTNLKKSQIYLQTKLEGFLRSS
ncbi:MAG: hypothetical protein VSS52_011840 [Thiotrichaceae bacterium]|nr:hypothetical protein [Thiotrichaceae bacterium]